MLVKLEVSVTRAVPVEVRSADHGGPFYNRCHSFITSFEQARRRYISFLVYLCLKHLEITRRM